LIGKRIASLNAVSRLADEGRAVWFAGWNGPKAAAFLMGMPARTLKLFIDRGLYEYRKEGRPKGGKAKQEEATTCQRAQ
jgi:hypothetical protein